ncbi:LysR family transcriptional regulator [Thalassotalea loyana]|uniref:LysR family transcriptional regulator n=1 Tax=Thalassotalea loyana TaxID=280483 RepID=A0ABQ6HAI9_9GAMM|nr:LysR family transcriptional regulator [Thalassotalea loyana]GLX85140.1 LysR family transcriptional regulator [Thalassotalea loyana]
MNGSTYNQLRVFHTIAQEGSITGAARILGIAAPSVSQSLKLLEQSLDLPLFTRTTRKIELTEAGELLYQRTLKSINELNFAFESVGDLRHIPRGKVRITLPRFVYQQILAPVYREFCQTYPEIDLEISINDGTVDIIEDGFDLGIRFGHRVGDEMVAKLLIPPKKDAFFASPAYIANYGMPKSIEEFSQHKYIYYRFISSNQLLPLTVLRNGQEVIIDAPCALVANDTDVIKDAALQGLGIGRLLETIVADELARGDLVPVLPELWNEMSGLYIFFHQNTQKAKRVRVLIDFLLKKATI